MGFILENRMPDGVKADGWYAGQNKKYHDMFNLVADKKLAKIFDDEDIARNITEALNKCGWNFKVLPS